MRARLWTRIALSPIYSLFYQETAKSITVKFITLLSVPCVKQVQKGQAKV